MFFKKYYYYILSVFGIWNNATYKSFRFSKPPLDEASAKITNKGAENRLKFSDEMSATISTRALCLMFIPQLAVVSMYAVATAGSPLLLYSAECRERLPPIILNNALEISQEREMNQSGANTSACERKVYWVVYLKSFRIYFELSRGIQYFIHLFQYITSFGLMYGNVLFWILLSMSILIPYSIASSLDVIVFVGKWFRVTDDDFSIIFAKRL